MKQSTNMKTWLNGILSKHARVLASIARNPEARLREIATSIGIAERRAWGIVDDLAQTGSIVNELEGRHNIYETQVNAPF
jgi:DNA-binding MarR family transcriptional regulator